MLTTFPLTAWTLSTTAETPAGAITQVDAPVPGSVHTALLDAGLIPHPFLDTNEAELLWIGRTPWRYTTVLPAVPELPADARVELVCDGLDTVADLALDGAPLAHTENMHRSYRFDVTGKVREGAELTIDFAPGIDEAYRRSEELGPRPHVNEHPFNSIRKMACSYGWDWNIETVTAGIWRDIRLEAWRVARLDRVLLTAEPDAEGGRLTARVRVQRAGDEPVGVRVEIEGRTAEATLAAGETEASVVVDVPGVRPWWPVGHGEQPLYPVSVVLTAGGETLDRTERRVGFRTVRFELLPDAEGTGVRFVVNDRPVMVRGVNWIPDHVFPELVDRTRYAERLHQALDAHVNLLRVWGGGIFSPDAFMELCDELGLLVWQDCLLACCLVSEDEPLRSEIEAEVRQNLGRLAGHPSLVLVNGNNENIWGLHDWEPWAAELGDRSWGAHYYYEMFPAIAADVVPDVPYTPGSPFSPEHEPTADDRGPNDDRWGTVHLWSQWNGMPAATYRDHRPRFVSEFGWQSPPTWTTLTSAIHDDPLTPDSPAMLTHQKAGDGLHKMTDGMAGITGVPEDFEAWHWAGQYTQADAVRTGIGWFRSLQPHCTGTVWWQLNDCWPVNSWAVIDGEGRKKPSWYALREVHEPRFVTVQPDGDGLRLAILNDTDAAWSGTASVRVVTTAGEELLAESLPVDVPARGEFHSELPAQATALAGDDRAVLVEVDGVRGWWWFAAPKDRVLEAARVRIQPEAGTTDGVRVRVTAETMLVDGTFLVDKLAPDAEADDALITLLPGESRTLTIRGLSADRVADLASVLVSANDFAPRS